MFSGKDFGLLSQTLADGFSVDYAVLSLARSTTGRRLRKIDKTRIEKAKLLLQGIQEEINRIPEDREDGLWGYQLTRLALKDASEPFSPIERAIVATNRQFTDILTIDDFAEMIKMFIEGVLDPLLNGKHPEECLIQRLVIFLGTYAQHNLEESQRILDRYR